MARAAKHENALVQAAAELFRKQGYAATGTAEILERSGAPRGSLYHYFPGGKEEMGAAAVVAAGKVLSSTITEIAAEVETTADFLEQYAIRLASWMEKSDFTDGNPVTTVVLETVPKSDRITKEAEKAYAIWADHIAALLARDNWPEDRRAATAEMILAALDGALIGTRIKRDKSVIMNTAGELAQFLRSFHQSG